MINSRYIYECISIIFQYKRKINITNMLSENYVALIMADGKHIDLFPLTHNYPASNLIVGNKLLIIYQLQQLQSISKLQNIFILHSQQNSKVKEYVQSEFLPANRQYPHKISFFKVQDNKPEYQSLRTFVNSEQYNKLGPQKGLIMVPMDLISSIAFSNVLQYHEQKSSDFTFLLKQKKQFGKGEKQPQVDFEPLIDVSLIANGDQVLSLDSLEDYQFAGLDIQASIYKSYPRATFYRVIDTKLYIMNENIIKIAQNLQIPDPTTVKHQFIPTLIKNQTNKTLLNFISKSYQKPLKIFAKLADQNEYIRQAVNLKTFEQLNMDSLIRGNKQKDILMPNKYSQPLDEKLMNSFKGCAIGTNTVIQNGVKMRRSTVSNGCIIGKNAEITNSILMEKVVVEENCKILDCIIGPKCIIKMDSSLKNCQLGKGCLIEKESKRDTQTILPMNNQM